MRRVSFLVVAMCVAAMLPAGAAEVPRDRAERAKAFIEMAPGMIAMAPPEAQAELLLRLAEVERKLDLKAARERLEQAVAAAGYLPDSGTRPGRRMMLAKATAVMAQLDLEKAIELLPMLGASDPREGTMTGPLTEVLRQLLARKDFERAVELGRLYGAADLSVLSLLLNALPPGAPERVALLGGVGSAFDNPYCESTCMNFLDKYREDLGAAQVRSLLDRQVRAVMEMKDDQSRVFSKTFSTPEGPVVLANARESALFDLLPRLKQVDPRAAEEILNKQPKLAKLLEQYPEGTASIWKSGRSGAMTTTISDGSAERQAAFAQRMAIENQQMGEAARHIAKDPRKALEIAEESPFPRVKQAVAEGVARGISSRKDPGDRALIERCVKLLEDGAEQQGAIRIGAWIHLAEAAQTLGDSEAALGVLGKAREALQKMRKREADPEKGNAEPRQFWESTSHYRVLFHAAGKTLGLEAVRLLEAEKDKELQVYGTVEFAAGLLELPAPSAEVRFSRREKK